jgi:hypothetical protein
MTFDVAETTERARRVVALMNMRLRSMTPQERDRTMQVHLAQARGSVANAHLLRKAVRFSVALRAQRKMEDQSDDG